MPEETKQKSFKSSEPYKENLHDKKVCQYIHQLKTSYQESDEYSRYRKKVFANEHQVRQEWRRNERTTRFGLKLGVARGYWEQEIAELENTWDVDEWLSISPKKSTEEGRTIAKGMEKFGNNVLNSIGYREHLFKRARYIPTCGWSVTFTDFHYQEGYQVKAKAKEGPIGGIEYLRSYETLRNQPRPVCVHPLNTFQSLTHMVWGSPYHGMIRRWTIVDVYDAMAKKTTNGEPIYNRDALEAMIRALDKREKDSDSDFHAGKPYDQTFSRNEVHTENKDAPYIDVLYFIGNLGGCPGYEKDPNQYIVECTSKLVLRRSENPADNYSPINHIQTDPLIDSPFPLTPLDKMAPHIRINDMMVNYGIESVLNSMTKFIVIDEDSLLNPERLKNPIGVLNILYKDASQNNQEFFEPILIGGDQRSGSLDDMTKFTEILDRDRQRSGITDQEMGIQGNTEEKTATAAQILKQSSNKTKQATMRRFMIQGVLDEMRYIVLLAFSHYDEEQLAFIGDEDSEQILGLPHVQMWLTNGIITWRDAITRDKERDNLEMLEWAEFAFKFLQATPQGQPTEYLVKLVRALGQNKNIPQDIIDATIPDVETPTTGNQPPPEQLPPGEELPPEQELPPPAPPEEPPLEPAPLPAGATAPV